MILSIRWLSRPTQHGSRRGRTTAVKIEHRYELLRDGLLLAEGETTLGCVGRDGRVQRLPPSLGGEDDTAPAG